MSAINPDYDPTISQSIFSPKPQGYSHDVYNSRRKAAAAEDSWSVGRWGSAVGEAAWKGAYHGLALDTPETFYRIVRTVGDMFGMDEWGRWAGDNLNEIKRQREYDPTYQVSQDVLDDPVARSIYGGISSLVTSLAAGVPGAVAGVATGGAGFIPMIAGYAMSAGGLFGLAEYDRFVDDAYSEFSKANPSLTWQQVQDEVHSDALLSAVAEGGLEMAGDLLAGKLLGAAGKSFVGSIGGRSVKGWRSFGHKLMKGMLITGPASELPSEMATAYIQNELRRSAGMTVEDSAKVMQDTFGPALVSSMIFGGGGAIAEHTAQAGQRGKEQQAYRAEVEKLKEQYQNNPAIKALREGSDDEVISAIANDAFKVISGDEQNIVTALQKEMAETSRPKAPTTLNPESAQFKEYLKTPLESYGLAYETPMGPKAGKRPLLRTVEDVYNIYNDLIQGKLEDHIGKGRKWQFGRIATEQAQAIKSSTGLDAEGGYFTIDLDELRHIRKAHPELTAEEFSLVPLVLSDFDTAPRIAFKKGDVDRTRRGSVKFILSKNIGQRYFACEAISKGKDKRLELISFYREDTDNKNASPEGEAVKAGMPQVASASTSATQPDFKSRGQMPSETESPDFTSSTNPDSINNPTTPETDVNKNIAESFSKYLRGEAQEMTPQMAKVFENMRGKIENNLNTAKKYGAVSDMDMARYQDLFGRKTEIARPDPELRAKAIEQQWNVIAGKAEPTTDIHDTVNSSILAPDMENSQNVMEYMNALAPEIEKLAARDQHTSAKLIDRAKLAIASNSINLDVFRGFNKSFENADTAMIAAGMMHEQMNREVTTAALEALKTGRQEDVAYATLKMSAANEMTELLSGMGTSAGRSLRALRTIKEKRGNELTDALHSVLGGEATKETSELLQRIIGNLVEVADPKNENETSMIRALQEEVSQILSRPDREGLSDEEWQKIRVLLDKTNFLDLSAQVNIRSRYERVRDMVLHSTIAGMLTGPATHITNTITGIYTNTSEVYDRLVAGLAFEGDVAIKGSKEARVMLHGAIEGYIDAFKNSWQAFKTGSSKFGNESEKSGQLVEGLSGANAYGIVHGTKYDMTLEQLEAAGGLGKLSKMAYQSFDVMAKAQKFMSTNMMLASDEFLKTMTYHMQRRALAERSRMMAEQQGMNGDEVYNSIMDGNNQNNTELHEELMQYAKYVTFQDSIRRDSAWTHAEQFRKKYPETMLIVPFLRTPLNIAKWAGVRTPGVAKMFKEYREATKDGADMATRQMAEARMLTGSMLWHTAMVLAAEGILTGSGPSDKDEREKLYDTGWRPNSLRIGKTYIELTRLDPLATFLNTMATFVEVHSELDRMDASEGVAATFGAAMKVVSDKYYLTGVNELLMAMRDWDRYGSAWVAKQANGFMPFGGARRAAARAMDPVMREAKDFVDMVKKDTPMASFAGAAKRTMLGETVYYEDSGLARALSPIRTATQKGDKVYDEIYRLSSRDLLSTSKPQRRITINGESVKLNSQQYSQYLALSGTGIKRMGLTAKRQLERIITSPKYKYMNDEDKAKVLDSTIRLYRSRARKVLISQDPELMQIMKDTQANNNPLAQMLRK